MNAGEDAQLANKSLSLYRCLSSAFTLSISFSSAFLCLYFLPIVCLRLSLHLTVFHLSLQTLLLRTVHTVYIKNEILIDKCTNITAVKMKPYILVQHKYLLNFILPLEVSYLICFLLNSALDY